MFYEFYSNEVTSSRAQFEAHIKGVEEMQMFLMF